MDFGASLRILDARNHADLASSVIVEIEGHSEITRYDLLLPLADRQGAPRCYLP